MTDKDNGIYGICLRGKAGWGENMAFLSAMANSFGARWFDQQWQPQFDGDAWKKTLSFYVKLMKETGPPGASSNGFDENLALFQSGKCGMWIDATVAASFVSNPKDSTVADQVGFALAPDNGLGKRSNWLGHRPWQFRLVPRKPTPPKNLFHGQPPRAIWKWSLPKKVGPTFLPEPAPRSMPTRRTRKLPLLPRLPSTASKRPTQNIRLLIRCRMWACSLSRFPNFRGLVPPSVNSSRPP